MALEYFSSKEVKPGVFQITNGIFDDALPTFCYLIIGRDAAVIVDSMYGVGSLKAYCESLTDKPLIHVCTHAHGDHTGGSYEFDDVYMSPMDFEPFWDRMPQDRESAMSTAQRRTLPQYKAELRIEDMVMPRVVRLHPLFPGDMIDLGERKLEVICTAGHTAGEIVLLDRGMRCIYSGDSCNTNTLLQLDDRCCVKDYYENLKNLSTYTGEFDTLMNGHDIQPVDIIAQGLEQCEKIMAGTDDHEPGQSFGGSKCFYGALRVTGGYRRVDGKIFNAAYEPSRIMEPARRINIITK